METPTGKEFPNHAADRVIDRYTYEDGREERLGLDEISEDIEYYFRVARRTSATTDVEYAEYSVTVTGFITDDSECTGVVISYNASPTINRHLIEETGFVRGYCASIDGPMPLEGYFISHTEWDSLIEFCEQTELEFA